MNNRNYTRVPYTAVAHIVPFEGDDQFDARVINLSLNGALIKTDHLLAMRTRLRLILFMTGGGPDVKVPLEGQVVRVAKNGFAVQFNMDKIPLNSFTFLRNIITNCIGNDEAVSSEYKDFLNSKTQL